MPVQLTSTPESVRKLALGPMPPRYAFVMIRPGVVVASVALACALVTPRLALADPTRKVTIDSDPEGAHVYLNAKEDGEKCPKTPCTIDAPIGETPLIVELENYEPSITMLEVSKGRGAMKQLVKLTAAARGGVDAKAMASAKGATVKLDGEDKGVAPVKIPTDVGSHHIEYVLDGKQVYEAYIDVEAGADYFEVAPTTAEAPPGPPPNDDPNPLEAGSAVEVGEPTPAKPHTRIVTGTMLFDVGFRQFGYDNGTGSNNRSESEQGQILAGPLIELYPTALFAPQTLPGLALVFRFQYGFNDQTVTGNGFKDPTTTYWETIEVSLRHRWMIKDKGTVEASAGYVQDRLQFNGNDADIALVPDANYQSVRFGARGSIISGNLEPYLALENRVVMSSGNLGARYNHASANGVRAAVGVGIGRGKLTGRFEASLLRYGSTFSNDMVSTTNQADGSSDVIEMISFGVGYSY